MGTNPEPARPTPAALRPGVRWGLVAGILGGCGCLSLLVIGVLAAVALPDFLAFNCKSLQAEAKISLTELYRAEMAFREQHGSYTSDLQALGWLPNDMPRYLYGFAKPGPGGQSAATGPAALPSDYDEQRSDTANPAFAGRIRTLHMTHMRTNAPLSAAGFPVDAVVGRDHFKAAAIGEDDPDRTTDVWTIDDQKDLVHVVDGCAR